MSITSVGASFGYIDPASVAGPAPSAPAPSDTDTVQAPSDASNQTGNDAQSGNPSPPPPQPTTSSTPKFSPATGAALVQVQEKATTA